MPSLFYIAPTETFLDRRGIIINKARRAKHIGLPGICRGGSVRMGHHDYHLAFVEGSANALSFIKSDKDCFVLTDSITLDDDLGSSTKKSWMKEFETREWPMHWLSNGYTKRQALSHIVATSLFSQRLEGSAGQSWPKYRKYKGLDLKSQWGKLSNICKAQLAFARQTLGLNRIDPQNSTQIRELFEVLSDGFSEKTIIIAGEVLQPDHSYGSREAATASDTFDGAISANWTNPAGPWKGASSTGMNATSAGTIDNETNFRTNSMIWNADSFSNDQWSQCNGDTHNVSSANVVTVARSNATDRAGYLANSSTSEFELREYSAGGTATVIATTTSGWHLILSGDTLTLECEGTTIRLGSEDSGGGDTERLSTTDATHASGRPGVGAYGSSTVEAVKITAWSAGDMAVSAGLSLPIRYHYNQQQINE